MGSISMAKPYGRGFPHGLMFHRFHEDSDASGWQGALSADDFEKILLFVGVENILSPHEWLAKLNNNQLQPNELCLTFDDGLRCQITHALPIMDKYNLKAFWFVYSCVHDGSLIKSEIYSFAGAKLGSVSALISEFLVRCPDNMKAQLNLTAYKDYESRISRVAPFYSQADIQYRFLRNQPVNRSSFETLMDRIVSENGLEIQELGKQLWFSKDELRCLVSQGHEVGLHSHSHPYAMAELTHEQQTEQYKKNYAYILDLIDVEARCMSHPLNSYNKDTLQILEELQVKCGFRANVFPPDGRVINPSRLEIAREDSSNLLHMLLETT